MLLYVHVKPHLIRSFSTIASTPLRQDALEILEAGLRAIETKTAVRASVSLAKNVLRVGRLRYPLDRYRRVFVVGIGKAAFEAGAALEEILGDRITDGIVLDVKGGKLKRIKSVVGTHPLPSMPNTRATGEIVGLLKGLDSRDLLITVVSGGGSALLCWPFGLKCEEISIVTDLLMKRAATIEEINTVRKHLSEIQGGQFARLAHPATVVGLIFSDVPGNDISMVASGPTVLDTTTVRDAARILAKYNIMKTCRLPDCDLKETPKDARLFDHVRNVLVVSNTVAIEAMRAHAKGLGYRPRLYSAEIRGEARHVGELLASLPDPGDVIIGAGETTVTVRGNGSGGRNQEVALGALTAMPEDVLVLSCASDGIDNTPVAGAIADAKVRATARKLRMNPEAYLRANDAYHFFKRVRGHVETGITGANVSDLMLAIRTKQ